MLMITKIVNIMSWKKKEKLLDLADEASKLGIELFVLDDGWFGNRFDDNRALGDRVANWQPGDGYSRSRPAQRWGSLAQPLCI